MGQTSTDPTDNNTQHHKQIPTALLGYKLFDSQISRQMGEFMVVSMTGGFMYSFAKLKVKEHELN